MVGLSKFIYLVNINVDRGIEEAWNHWYDEKVPKALKCPGFVDGVRFVATPVYQTEADRRRYLSFYEINTPDALYTPELSAIRGWGRFTDHVRTENAIYELRAHNIGK